MKKISVVFLAMVLAMGMAMAQKTAWLTQSGTSNSATITQNALVSGDATAIYADQSGNSNSLVSSQSGKSNYVKLTEEGSSNVASMQQFALNNGTSNLGYTNTADVTQSGSSNNVSLTQKENGSGTDYSNNTAHATQSGSSNTFNLTQGSANGMSINASYLVQSGNSNVSGIGQYGLTNYSEISQNNIGNGLGNGNYASLNQVNPTLFPNSTLSASSWDISNSWQDGGQNNILAISQTGISVLQKATSDQDGYNNKTTINQVSMNEQDVISTQRGTDDNIIVSQSN